MSARRILVVGGRKQCARCGVAKPLEAFHRQPSHSTGRTSRCKECGKIWAQQHPERIRAAVRRYRERRPRPEAISRNERRYRERHPDKVKVKRARGARRYRARYKTDEMFRNRENEMKRRRQTEKKVILAGRPKPDLCELCGRAGKRIVFDHDHLTGKFRGWLCSSCNTVLGKTREDIALLMRMITYIRNCGIIRELSG